MSIHRFRIDRYLVYRPKENTESQVTNSSQRQSVGSRWKLVRDTITAVVEEPSEKQKMLFFKIRNDKKLVLEDVKINAESSLDVSIWVRNGTELLVKYLPWNGLVRRFQLHLDSKTELESLILVLSRYIQLKFVSSSGPPAKHVSKVVEYVSLNETSSIAPVSELVPVSQPSISSDADPTQVSTNPPDACTSRNQSALENELPTAQSRDISSTTQVTHTETEKGSSLTDAWKSVLKEREKDRVSNHLSTLSLQSPSITADILSPTEPQSTQLPLSGNRISSCSSAPDDSTHVDKLPIWNETCVFDLDTWTQDDVTLFYDSIRGLPWFKDLKKRVLEGQNQLDKSIQQILKEDMK